MRVLRLVAASALSGLFIAAAANADHIIGLDSLTYVSKDTFVDQVTDASYVVGYANKNDYHDRTNGVGVTLTLTENARVHNAVAASGSIINSSGQFPSPTGGLGAIENGVANMGGGLAYFMTASDNGAINMSGGRTNFAWFQGSSTGNFGNAIIGNPTFPTGGTYLEVRENSSVTLNGTHVVEQLRAINSGRITALGATVGHDVIARNGSRIDFIGGTLDRDLITFDQAAVSGNGGSIARDVAANGGSISLDGTTVGRDVRNSNIGSLTLNNVTIAKHLFAEGPATMTGGVVNGNATKVGFGPLAISGARVAGDVTAIGEASALTLSSVMVGGNVSARIGSITDTHIGGNLTTAGAGTVTTLNVSGGAIDGDLLMNGRAAVNFSGHVAGDAVIGGLAFLDMTGGTIAGDLTNGNFGTIRGGDVQGHLHIDVGYIQMLGGRVGLDVNVANDSQFLLTNGAVGRNVLLAANGVLEMNGGAVERDVELSPTARALLNRGTVGGSVTAPAAAGVVLDGATITGHLELGDGSQATVEGGIVVGSILASGTGATRVQMTGGVVGGDVNLAGGALLAFRGGRVEGDIAANGSSVVTIEDGTVGRLLTAADARAVVNGGTFGEVQVAGASAVQLDGGEVNDLLLVQDSATVTTAADLRDIRASGSGQITVNGGSHSGVAVLKSKSSMTVHQGNLGGLVVEGDALLLLDNTAPGPGGGTGVIRTAHIDADDFSRVIVTGPRDLFITSLSTAHLAVAMLNGGNIEKVVFADDRSTVTITHGALLGEGVFAEGQATVSMDAGTVVGDVRLVEDSTFALSGGIVQGNVLGRQRNFMDLSGGQVDLATAEQESEIIFGGTATAKKIEASGFGRLLMHGGTIATDVVGIERAVMTVSGDVEVEGYIEVEDDVRLFMTGGVVRKDLIAKEQATLHVSGGRIVGRVLFSKDVTFHWSGGTINGDLPVPTAAPVPAVPGDAAPLPAAVNVFADGASTLNVYGTDLEATLLDANYQDLYTLYRLTGVFADGTIIDGVHFATRNGTGASYHLLPPSAIPEPAQAGLLLAVAASCGFRRRTRSSPHARGACRRCG